MLFLLFTSWLHASTCPIQELDVWAHYADEWGHEAKPIQILKRQDIRIDKYAGQWIMWPKTCTAHACDVSFLLKLKNGCWKPLVSVQGKVRPKVKGDWQTFVAVVSKSSIDANKTREILWRFDSKELVFTQLSGESVK